jgi:ribosomal protein S12 methylthiotransferase accessory factor
MSWVRSGAVDTALLGKRYSFSRLVRPQTGLIQGATFLPQEVGSPAFEVASTSLGNLTMTFPHVRDTNGADVRNKRLGGAGADIDPEMAWVRAVVEGAERYASMVWDADDFIVASANDLGERALDLDTIPSCSAEELADPKCPLCPMSKSEPMRWVRGYSLTAREERLVPAVMSHLYIGWWPSERFWLPISTGVAAHTSLAAALTSAICEAVERDAIALTWLARLPLPRIEIERPLPLALQPLYDRLERSRVRQYFFDATTDLGIPTVFSVQLCEGHPTCSLFVSCATSIDPVAACGKCIREAAPSRNVMLKDRAVPEDIRDFTDITNGADYYGHGEHRSDFDFLLKGGSTTTLAAMREGLPVGVSDERVLAHLIGRLKSCGHEVVAIDLTTNELREAGLWVVRAVLPRLVPISFVHRARYLATPRIYEYARRMGIDNLTLASVNPGPMPFA